MIYRFIFGFCIRYIVICKRCGLRTDEFKNTREAWRMECSAKKISKLIHSKMWQSNKVLQCKGNELQNKVLTYTFHFACHLWVKNTSISARRAQRASRQRAPRSAKVRFRSLSKNDFRVFQKTDSLTKCSILWGKRKNDLWASKFLILSSSS